MLSTVFQSGLSRSLRAIGASLEGIGRALEVNANVEKLQPSLRSVKFNGAEPKMKATFVAPTASVIGNVTIGALSSVWYGAVLRGDGNPILVGDGVTIGDRVMIHTNGSSHPKAFPAVVGNRCIVGAGAILHGCTLEDDCIVGEGAQVMDGAVVGRLAVVAAGAIVTSGKRVPSGQLWAGVPATFVREVNEADLSLVATTMSQETLEQATLHALECRKDWNQVEEELFDHEQEADRCESFPQRMTQQELSDREGEVENHAVPGMIFNSPITAKDQNFREKG